MEQVCFAHLPALVCQKSLPIFVWRFCSFLPITLFMRCPASACYPLPGHCSIVPPGYPQPGACGFSSRTCLCSKLVCLLAPGTSPSPPFSASCSLSLSTSFVLYFGFPLSVSVTNLAKAWQILWSLPHYSLIVSLSGFTMSIVIAG